MTGTQMFGVLLIVLGTFCIFDDIGDFPPTNERRLTDA